MASATSWALSALSQRMEAQPSGEDHRIDAVLEQEPVPYADGQGAAGAPLADDGTQNGCAQVRHNL